MLNFGISNQSPTAWAKNNFALSSQPVNAKWEMVVPTVGTTYVDNVCTLENRSVNSSGNRGNAAFRMRDAKHGVERGAFGYSATDDDNPAFIANAVYVEHGNLSTDTHDSDFRVVNTHLAGAVNMPGTQYTAMQSRGSNGELTFQAGPTGSAGIYMIGNIQLGSAGVVRQFQVWGNSTSTRLREGDNDDLFRWSTNANNANVQDNAAKSSWRAQMGYGAGEDRFRISRIAPGGSTWADYFTVTAGGVTSVGEIGTPRSMLVAGKTSALRLTESGGDDLFHITTNLGVNGTTKDAAGLTAWDIKMGAGAAFDGFSVSRTPTGTTTPNELFKVHSSGVVQYKVLTFATLPASPVAGMTAVISDGVAATYHAIESGGGTVFNRLLYTGTAWVVA